MEITLSFPSSDVAAEVDRHGSAAYMARLWSVSNMIFTDIRAELTRLQHNQSTNHLFITCAIFCEKCRQNLGLNTKRLHEVI